MHSARKPVDHRAQETCRMSFFEVVCTGIRGIPGVVQAGLNTRLFKPACTKGILSQSRLDYL